MLLFYSHNFFSNNSCKRNKNILFLLVKTFYDMDPYIKDIIKMLLWKYINFFQGQLI